MEIQRWGGTVPNSYSEAGTCVALTCNQVSCKSLNVIMDLQPYVAAGPFFCFVLNLCLSFSVEAEDVSICCYKSLAP